MKDHNLNPVVQKITENKQEKTLFVNSINIFLFIFMWPVPTQKNEWTNMEYANRENIII